MKYLIACTLLLSCFVFSANTALASDTFDIKNTYVAPSLDLGNIFAISPEQGIAYSSVFNINDRVYDINVFYRESDGNYIFQNIFQLDESIRANSLLITDNQLVVLSETSAVFLSIGARGQLSELKTQDLREQLPSGSNLFGKVLAAGQGRYILYSNDFVHFITIDNSNQVLTIIDSIDALGDGENTVQTVIHAQYRANDDSLWLMKNSGAFYRFEQLDLSMQTLNQVAQYDYTFSADFDAVNDAGISYAHHNAESNAVLVQTDRRTFIFELDASQQSVSLAYNQAFVDDSFIAGSPETDEHLISRGIFVYLAVINWDTLQPVLVNTGLIKEYTTYTFISANDLIGQNPFEQRAEMFSLQQGQFVATNAKLSSQLADALPKRLISTHYDTATSHIIMLGSEASTRTIPRLYAWQYSSETDSADFIVSSEILIPEAEAEFYNFNILGTYSNYIYVYSVSNLNSQSEILVFELINNELALIQTLDWSGSSDITMIDHAFIAPNKLALFPYIPAGNTFFMRVCDIASNGQVSACSDKPILDGKVFNVDSNSYVLTDLQDTNQLILAPKRSLFTDIDQDTATWFLNYNTQTDQFNTLQTISSSAIDGSFEALEAAFTFAGGQKLSLRYSVNQFLLIWNASAQQWSIADAPHNSAFLNNPMATTESSYFLADDGRPYLLDLASDNFYRSDQRLNVGSPNSVYQVGSGNKGYIIDIDSRVSLLTFELVDTTPTYYKGGLPDGGVEAIQNVPFTIDFADFFLNLKDDSIDLTFDGIDADVFNDSKLTWNGRILAGDFDNEDMFADANSNVPASDIFVSVELNNQFLGRFRIVPVNVNDTPELIGELETQFLEPNQVYEGSMSDLVIDPDREVVVYSFSNLPAGVTGTEDGSLRANISAEGEYTIDVLATDPNGATLLFSIRIVVSRTQTQPDPPPQQNPGGDSGGGGGALTWFTFIALLLAVRKRRYVVSAR